jgi:hypothetical protein
MVEFDENVETDSSSGMAEPDESIVSLKLGLFLRTRYLGGLSGAGRTLLPLRQHRVRLITQVKKSARRTKSSVSLFREPYNLTCAPGDKVWIQDLAIDQSLPVEFFDPFLSQQFPHIFFVPSLSQ